VFRKQFVDVQDAWVLAHAIVDTVREPLVVLDQDFRVVAASQSFYLTFKVTPEHTLGKLLYDLVDGQWDIPRLRVLLGKILPEQGAMENYDVEHDFPGIGRRTMLLNARKVFYEAGSHSTILLGIEDITEKRNLENEKDDLIRQKQMLLEELEHRVVNSLQIIASIIMLKARAVESEETRRHLEDAHNRVISVATVQRHLHGSVANAMIEMRPYLETLCAALAQSMISDNRPISIKFDGKGGASSRRDAESIGLIVTELVINSLKHAFKDTSKDGAIRVSYDVSGTDWQLAVSDNGCGKPDGVFAQPKTGLGTGVVKALAKQLDAQVVTVSGALGTKVSVTHATFAPADLARAAGPVQLPTQGDLSCAPQTPP
jgi:two-component sensor histidine kinase